MSLTKADFRSYCLKRMKHASSHNKRYKDTLLGNKLSKILILLKVRSVLLYWPLPFEADLRKMLQKSRRQRRVFLPFMVGESFKMVAFRLPLEKKAFGIFEPKESHKITTHIDIAIVPAIGVDGSMRRIGFGKGMYDRFFENLPKPPIIIFVQPELCKTSKFVCDDYDVSADLLATPRRLYGARGTTNVKRFVFNVKRSFRRRRHCHR